MMSVCLQEGDRVRYEQWEGIVSRVLNDGSVYIDFQAANPGVRFFSLPFFRGPYQPHEIAVIFRVQPRDVAREDVSWTQSPDGRKAA